jgi:hypothetical protein
MMPFSGGVVPQGACVMPRKQHIVRLTTAERRELDQLITTGVGAAWRLTRARILLKADRGVRGRRWTDQAIAEAVEVSPRTVARVRAAFGAGGVAAALARKPPAREYVRKLDGAGEAVLVELVCGGYPEGKKRWSLRLLSDQLVALGVVEQIAPNTVRAVLNKTSSNPGGCASGTCPGPMRPS